MAEIERIGRFTVPPGRGDRPAHLHAIGFGTAEIEAKARTIHAATLAGSRTIREPNFTRVSTEDLEFLFRRYDADFFGGLLSRFLHEDQRAPISFRLSSRMTNAAGKAIKSRRRELGPGGVIERDEYQIAVSSTILFATFRDPTAPACVAGRICRDRLEALQRTFEHELLHISEFLAWGSSSCSAPNFRRLSLRIFGHEASNHELVTPREEAAEVHGVRVGDLVAFDHEGVRRRGRINRITRRATVLVEDPAGRKFSDGKTYATFYVPLPMLRKAPQVD